MIAIDLRTSESNPSGIDGNVEFFADLPNVVTFSGQVYVVEKSSGLWLLNRKNAGMYRSNGVDWVAMDDFPDVFNDANFEVFNDSDNTKAIKLDASNITTGTKRTLTMDDRDVDIANLFDVTIDDAFDIDFTPSDDKDWPDPDPTDVGEALDDLASANNIGNFIISDNALSTVLTVQGVFVDVVGSGFATTTNKDRFTISVTSNVTTITALYTKQIDGKLLVSFSARHTGIGDLDYEITYSQNDVTISFEFPLRLTNEDQLFTFSMPASYINTDAFKLILRGISTIENAIFSNVNFMLD